METVQVSSSGSSDMTSFDDRFNYTDREHPIDGSSCGGARPETVYSAHGHLGVGWAGWAEMANELWASRELTWRLFLRDFSARYRQSVLGILWAVFPVLVTVVVFSWLNRANVLSIKGTTLPYPVYVLVGMSVWQLFAGGVTNATQSLVNAGSLITKINFPRETLVLAAFGQSLFEFIVRVGLILGAFVVYRVTPSWAILLVPLALVPLCLFTIGLGYVLSLVNGVMRDAGQVITLVLTFWMFLTPVVYPASSTGVKGLINVLNPVSPFVIATQDLITHGTLTQVPSYVVGTVVSTVVFVLCWRIFHLTETRIPERI